MRKLRLELDALEVETFDTRAGIARPAGTVRAYDSDEPANTNNVMSCGGTCWLTPNVCGTCGGPTAFDPTCEGNNLGCGAPTWSS
ncbi:MAG TPA: hypothetical protein VM890_16900 [Longimicrobium sp.]|jgi:hypothetical protein|nr:hypothetical protein [Longimicrobium sp.]